MSAFAADDWEGVSAAMCLCDYGNRTRLQFLLRSPDLGIKPLSCTHRAVDSQCFFFRFNNNLYIIANIPILCLILLWELVYQEELTDRGVLYSLAVVHTAGDHSCCGTYDLLTESVILCR